MAGDRRGVRCGQKRWGHPRTRRRAAHSGQQTPAPAQPGVQSAAAARGPGLPGQESPLASPAVRRPWGRTAVARLGLGTRAGDRGAGAGSVERWVFSTFAGMWVCVRVTEGALVSVMACVGRGKHGDTQLGAVCTPVLRELWAWGRMASMSLSAHIVPPGTLLSYGLGAPNYPGPPHPCISESHSFSLSPFSVQAQRETTAGTK